MADWLQGSYQYALYKHMGYSLRDIAFFYVVGFTSSALLGTWIGSLADRKGRKMGALAFCLVYGISCATKLSSHLVWVLVGRITGILSLSPISFTRVANTLLKFEEMLFVYANNSVSRFFPIPEAFWPEMHKRSKMDVGGTRFVREREGCFLIV